MFNLFKKPKVTEKVYNKFIDTGVVDESILKLIAIKVIESRSLSEWERCIFFDKTSEINTIIVKITKK
jgi:hypothetical protein